MRLLLGLLLVTASLAAATQEPVVRDAGLWPFSATSPWNMALGDLAVLQPIVSPRFAVSKGGCLNAVGFSHPVYLATKGDPEVSIFRTGTATPFATVRVPTEAKPDPKGDAHLHIIDETRRSVIEMWHAVRNADGSITATAVVRNDLTDEGVYQAWHGVRAYGGSAIAGLIRSGELTLGIRHALAIAVEQASLNRNGPGGKAFVWPASSCDSNNAYGSSGNLYMGSLLAIPAQTDLRATGLRGPALELGLALQDYGAYITDCTGTNLSFYAEPAATAEVEQVARADIGTLVGLLHVVANNSPQTVAGGGKRRRPAAPPFAPPGQQIVSGGLPPAIASGPAEVTVQAGASIALKVSATGSEPLTFRWRRGSATIGANTAELTIAAARPGDNGLYACTVTNAYGKVGTAPVRVTVVGGEETKPTRPAAAVVAAWTTRLQSAVRSSLSAHRVPQYHAELLRSTVSIQDLTADGTLTIVMAGGGSLQVPWAQLHDGELASMASDLARGEDPQQHALAAFFLFMAGDIPGARLRLVRAGAEAAAVESLFAALTGG